jgi:hypothetical protein
VTLPIEQPKRKWLANVEPWSKSALGKACKQLGRERIALEEAAIQARGKPDLDD